MKERIRKKVVKAYAARIAAAKTEYELKGIDIEYSRKCSAYQIGWGEFLEIKKFAQARAIELGFIIH